MIFFCVGVFRLARLPLENFPLANVLRLNGRVIGELPRLSFESVRQAYIGVRVYTHTRSCMYNVQPSVISSVNYDNVALRSHSCNSPSIAALCDDWIFNRYPPAILLEIIVVSMNIQNILIIFRYLTIHIYHTVFYRTFVLSHDKINKFKNSS